MLKKEKKELKFVSKYFPLTFFNEPSLWSSYDLGNKFPPTQRNSYHSFVRGNFLRCFFVFFLFFKDEHKNNILPLNLLLLSQDALIASFSISQSTIISSPLCFSLCRIFRKRRKKKRKEKLEFNAYNGNGIYLSPDFIFRSAFNAFHSVRYFSLSVERNSARERDEAETIFDFSSSIFHFPFCMCVCRFLFFKKKKRWKHHISVIS